jgi:fructan beta-fructosidase
MNYSFQRPVREVANLRKDAVCEDNIVIGSYKSYQLDSSVKAVEISAEVQYDQAAGFSMEISFGNDETVVISVDGENEEIILDRSKSGNVGFSHYFKDIFHAPLIQVKEYIKLNVFVDMNAIEVFVDEGMITMSSLIFPRECVKSVKISAISEDVVLKNLKIYNLS